MTMDGKLRPMFGSLACSLHLLRRKGDTAKADRLLASHNHIRKWNGQPPYDEAADWTDIPMECWLIIPAKGGPVHVGQ